MNQKEWKEFCKIDKAKAHYWYNKARKFLKSKEFESLENCDLNAKVIHHLRDTEEQRKYNDEHYELFGFEIDENGNEHFEYGKYVVFWTKDHHSEYHKCSEETRKKLSISGKAAKNDKDVREEMSNRTKNLWKDGDFRAKMLNIFSSEEHRNKLSKANLGHTHTEETKKKMSDSHKGHETSEETRKKIGLANKGNKARLGMKNSKESNEKRRKAMIGFRHSDEAKANMSVAAKKSRGACAAKFKAYKDSGGELSWNEFQANFKTMFANKFSIGTIKQAQALCNAKNLGVKISSYDDACKYLESVGLLVDDGYKYGSKWLYRAIPEEDLKEIVSLLAE